MCAVKLECVSGIGKTPARYASSTSPALKSSDNATRSWSGQSSSGPKACDRLTIPSCHQRRQRPVTTGPRTPTAAPRGGTPPWREQKGSEIELIDVVLVELVGIAEEHRVVGVDGELAELAGGEGVALLAGDLTLDEGRGSEAVDRSSRSTASLPRPSSRVRSPASRATPSPPASSASSPSAPTTRCSSAIPTSSTRTTSISSTSDPFCSRHGGVPPRGAAVGVLGPVVTGRWRR